MRSFSQEEINHFHVENQYSRDHHGEDCNSFHSLADMVQKSLHPALYEGNQHGCMSMAAFRAPCLRSLHFQPRKTIAGIGMEDKWIQISLSKMTHF